MSGRHSVPPRGLMATKRSQLFQGAFITLVGEMRLLPLLLQTMELRLGLREFSGSRFCFMFGGVIGSL